MNKLKSITLILILFQLTACIDTEKNKLENRVKDFWELKINKQFKEAYKFLSPGWRKTDYIDAYEQRMLNSMVNWTGYEFVEKKCDTTSHCKVVMKIFYEFLFKSGGNKLMKLDSFINETWILNDNKWYLLPIKKNMKEK